MLYKDMNAAQRFAAYSDFAQAVEAHINGFIARPLSGTRRDTKAAKHYCFSLGRMDLIRNVAKKAGDGWAQ